MAHRRSKGEGSISQTTRGWLAQITLPDGKRRSKNFKDQKSAREWLLLVRKELSDGAVVDKDIRLDKFLELYIRDVATHNLREKTLQAYESLIRIHIKPELGYYKLSQLSPPIIQKFYSKKLETLSKRTVQFIHSILHKALDQALRWNMVIRNVCDLVDAPSPKRSVMNVWSPEQARLFLKFVENDRFYPLYALAIGTGMREGELLGIYWEDVDFIKSEISVQRALQYLVGKGLVLTEPKTDKSRRSVSVAKFAMDALRNHFDASPNKLGLVFVTKNNTPFSPRNIVRHFKLKTKEAGLPEIRFHDLRHTAATLMLSGGIHPKVVQEMLGHSQISLTLDTYSHVVPSLQKEAAEKINDLMHI
ncbi:MAG: Integrase family protein [Candidatus Shapirobacteria bacterium GW2011_GWF1_38_23]|nr:MAG: Integrase family protein [Candidatus Shapirobacteria bacterium GW2011_GWF1_38_23]